MDQFSGNLSIASLFCEWEDYDVSRYLLACSLGLLEFDNSFNGFREHKGVFYTDNRISTMLGDLLDELTRLGFLEENDYSQFRYKKSERTLEEIAYNR